MNYASTQQRANIQQRLAGTSFDLLVVGGGVTGAGIALDAATRGLSVALVEKDDFASGTSSKSTKLIHGGLRYLKQLEVGLVREVGRERAIVHRLAPHLVKAEKMLLPLIKGGTFGPIASSLGLKVYDFVAGVRGDDRRRMLGKQQTLKKEPLLDAEGLIGSGYYAEYRTDDARLTIELIKEAIKHGAVCLNYTQVNQFTYDQRGIVNGVECSSNEYDGQLLIKVKKVISAAGPWVDRLRQKDGSLEGKHLFHSKGSHIVVPHVKLPIRQSVYFDVPDGRMIFAIPRQRVTYIGTTDTTYKANLDHIYTTQEDVDYLLTAVNNMFPDVKLTIDDVESSWAGLRPLIYEEGKSPSEMSRRDEIFHSDTGLISIAGGKLTGYRKMAERVVDLAVKELAEEGDTDFKETSTHQQPLAGGYFKNAAEAASYQNKLEKNPKLAGLRQGTADYLVHCYGKQTDAILELLSSSEVCERGLLLAEAEYCIQHELSYTLEDFFERRTGRIFFNMPSVRPHAEAVADRFAELLGWTDQQRQDALEQLDRAIKAVTVFPMSEEEESYVSSLQDL